MECIYNTLRYDIAAFRRMMYFIMLTYSISLVIFFLFPNCQQLRPASFPRDNVLTRFLATSTPSIPVPMCAPPFMW